MLWQPQGSCPALPGSGRPSLARVQASVSKSFVELHEGTLSHTVVYPQAANIAILPKIINALQEVGFPSCLEEQVLLHGQTLGFYLCFELEDESVRGVIYFCLMGCINSQSSVRLTCKGPCVEGQCDSPVTNSPFCVGLLSSGSWTLAGELSIYRTLLPRRKGTACRLASPAMQALQMLSDSKESKSRI